MLLAATLTVGFFALAAPAFAGNAVWVQEAIARYEGAPVNAVHIDSMKGGASGSGTGRSCQSWWRYGGGTVFYSVSLWFDFSFTYANDGATVWLSAAGPTIGGRC